jgi:hypothetical protein
MTDVLETASTIKAMVAARTFETLVDFYENTWHNVSEDAAMRI